MDEVHIEEGGYKDDSQKVNAYYSYILGRAILLGLTAEGLEITQLIKFIKQGNMEHAYICLQNLYKILLNDLTPLDPADVCRICKFGAEKYGMDNYKKGMKWSRLIAAYLRHDMRIQEFGEHIDQESGLPHIAHKASNLQMLAEYIHLGAGENDL